MFTCEFCGKIIKGKYPYTPNDNIFCKKCSNKYFVVRKKIVENIGIENITNWSKIDLEVIKQMKGEKDE